MFMKKLSLLFLLFIAISAKCFSSNPPDEGMWLPMFIERLNYTDMQKMGLKLSPQELYSINNSSMKDAIVSLGFFCTAEVISDEGLILTNHHCGYESIQSHSTIDHDYLTDGFWAYSKSEELPNEGLTASFLVRMEDVTSKFKSKLSNDMSEKEREEKIEAVSAKLQNDASEGGKYDVEVKSFFDGNEFYMFVYETYRDVRLVGAPPSAIGKFGGDTDNWMWPRHTGDFSMFRIYTAPDGSPADYDKKNIPMKPKHSLPISIKGVKKDDFAMVWGYPGTTERYETSYAVDMQLNQNNPTIVSIRDTKLSIMKKDMDADNNIKIKYASKYAQTANYWKYFIGQSRMLKRLDIIGKKKELEMNFTAWVNEDKSRKEEYGDALKLIENGYAELKKYKLSETYLSEVGFQGPEIVYFAFGLNPLYKILKNNTDKTKEKKSNADIKIVADVFRATTEKFFKDYNAATDKKLYAALFKMYYDNVPKDQHPDIFITVEKKYKGCFETFAEELYSKSFLVSPDKLNEFLNKPSLKVMEKDLGFMTMRSILQTYRMVYEKTLTAQEEVDKGNRLFVKGLMEMYPDNKFYPNANSTMRMSYGQVLDYYPMDAVHYDYITTIKGIIEKEDPKNDEFVVPSKLKELYNKKDFGKYGMNDNMVVCFLTNNDITGGNSGSPVINGEGQLIGIAFDGNWEAMSGDIAYEPNLQRTICVDIRYVLFCIDKLAGAQNLINEMKIVE
jgi:hypothetical protein